MSSSHIPEEAVERVKAMLRGRVTDLRVVVRQDCVVLLGKAANYYSKQLAQHFILKAVGAAVLVNEIEVRRISPAPDPDDVASG
jgi:hypothetical protein